MFETFGVHLVHGWAVDPQEEETFNVVVREGGSYNRVVEMCIAGDEAGEKRLAGEEGEKAVHNGLVCRNFLATTASQLTYHGLSLLSETLPPNSLSVLFRNNHFHTLLKRGSGDLYTLVTDQGFLRTHGAVWESLGNLEGDSEFVDGLFRPFESGGVDEGAHGHEVHASVVVREGEDHADLE
ncbi:hypothetical protein BDK51DRAFT_23319 [Blyttiomyces helicus]|uniref:MINDY deubiquitinase domain-containing protein n=1 Tax=Blyttiomyces helicus TaxID=388810 RepID=A0A4P9VVZ2_9FUNG|nr:hypothetical protein BDK51DRAFT_23319 [Blyttiomyces helicus]|eukprot:RKO83854.1 hypothetical protein BDK51DRAFT_23319 [Blyttiomyces helicus]